MPAAFDSPAQRLWRAGVGPEGLGPADLPPVWGRASDVVLYLIEWVHQRVRKIVPDERWLRERYMRRSVLEMLAEGTTLCIGPCPERTLVAAAALSLRGMPYRIVVHERQILGGGPPTVHFAIEIDDDGSPFWFDFGSWESRFYPGTYTYRANIERNIMLRRFELPFSEQLLGVRADQMMHMAQTREVSLERKLDWYLGELDHMHPVQMEDHIVFTDAASHYRPRPLSTPGATPSATPSGTPGPDAPDRAP